MAKYIVQQRDLDILRQSEKVLYSKIELLNHNMKVIDYVEGSLINDSISIDSQSDIRRTYSCELFVKDSSFFIGKDKKIWIDRYLRPYVGIKYLRTNEIIWYLMGTYTFNDTSFNYDETIRSLSLSCSDLMCTLNGDRAGYVEGLSNIILEGTKIRNAIIGILNEIGITKYRVDDIGSDVPYDLEFSVGTTYHQMLKELVGLYAGYEMFFDIEGTFIVQKIPTTKNEVSIMDETIINPLVKSEGTANTFNNIYNYTQVWGSVIETDYYTKVVISTDGLVYNATFEDVVELENFAKYGIKVPINNISNPTLNINGNGNKEIVDDTGKTIDANRLLANTDYVVKYRKATNDFLLLGQYQAYGEYKCNETDNQFSIQNLGYEIKQVLQFDELYSDSLCEQRAKYETWLATRMKDTITLNMLFIPFLDVNWKITYQSFMTDEISDYIIKSINGSNSDFSMTVTLIKYSELYPDMI